MLGNHRREIDFLVLVFQADVQASTPVDLAGGVGVLTFLVVQSLLLALSHLEMYVKILIS